jgi:hypothetical protein
VQTALDIYFVKMNWKTAYSRKKKIISLKLGSKRLYLSLVRIRSTCLSAFAN